MITPPVGKPLFLVHDTADGFVYVRVVRAGPRWREHRWGDQLEGGSEWPTVRQANEQAVKSFREMFPEHRCTDRCCLNPAETGTRSTRNP